MDRASVSIIVSLLAIFGFTDALTCLFVPLIYFQYGSIAAYSPLTPAQTIAVITMVIYVYAMAIVDFCLAIGFLKKYNKARVLALILPPAPFLGALLYFLKANNWLASSFSLLLQYTGL